MTARDPSTPRRKQAGSVEALVAALATGHTVKTAAQQAKMSEATAHRRLAEPAVRQQLADFRLVAVERAADRLAAFAVGAADALARIIADTDTPPAVTVQACNVVLNRVIGMRDAATVEARLAEIEAVLEARRPSWKPQVPDSERWVS